MDCTGEGARSPAEGAPIMLVLTTAGSFRNPNAMSEGTGEPDNSSIAPSGGRHSNR